ncbi:hypothetical protein [Halomarina rubra]|uniref:Transposase n=1 Tax=Halomarina rubra TaxID=2071873 RepID=A0ABD6ASI9_9EURY|nr:hypothetical protein [Halomarina rubra]
MGFERNIVAALKSRANGDISEESWALRESFFASWQLHLTLYSGEGGVDVYAHWERSRRRHPWKHLDNVGFNAKKGVQMTRSRFANRGVRIEPEWS